MAGGIFQLIASHGAQDRYLMGNYNLFHHLDSSVTQPPRKVYQPKPLKEFCTLALTEQQKTWIVANRTAFEDIAERIMKVTKLKYDLVVVDIKSIGRQIQKTNGEQIVHKVLFSSNVYLNTLYYRKSREKAFIRYNKTKKEVADARKLAYINQQKSQQHAVQRDRQKRRIQFEMENI